MKILIIGKNGFVGRNLGEYFNNAQLVSSKELNLLSEKSVRSFFENNYYDVVINTAVFNPNKFSESERLKELEYDLRMFHNIAKCYKLFGKMIYFGSGAEYDKRYPICSVSEDDLNYTNNRIDDEFKREKCSGLIPSTQYGLAKYIIGKEIESGVYGSDNIYNLRIFGLFGKYENYKTTFISGACCKAVFDRPITIRQNVFFDYLYIDDFCKMLEYFINIKKPKFHTYNIVSGKRVSLLEIAHIINKISNKDLEIKVLKNGLNNEYTANNARLLSEIGDYMICNIEDSIKKLYRWYDNSSEFIKIDEVL